MLSKSIKILIITGHGQNDVGAVFNNLIERDMNVICGKAFFDKLKQNGFNVTLETNNVPVDGEMALSNGYDLVISVHFNAGRGDGFECYYNPSNNETLDICKNIEKRVLAFGQNSRGLKNGTGYKMVTGIKPHAIILEGGFIDNPTDSALFDEPQELKLLGETYALGLMDYFGITEQVQSKDGFFRVVCGSYKERSNAEKQQKALQEKGFNSFLVFENI